MQKNAIFLLDSSGAVVVQYDYDAWGNCRVRNGNGTEITDTNHIGNLNPFRYRSYYFDTETKLYFLQSRYYDPEIGRFLTIDDISYLAPDNVNGLNLYAYCLNNPVMGYDPTGTIPKWFAWAISGLAIIGGVIMVATGVGATAGGILIAAGVGSIVGGYVNEANGGSFTAGWLGGLVTGALCALGGALGGALTFLSIKAGSVLATIGLFGGGIMTSFALGAAGSYVGSIINSSVDKTEFNQNDAVFDAIVTGSVSIFSASGVEFSKLMPIKDILRALISYFTEGLSDLFSYLMGKTKRKEGNPVKLFG